VVARTVLDLDEKQSRHIALCRRRLRIEDAVAASGLGPPRQSWPGVLSASRFPGEGVYRTVADAVRTSSVLPSAQGHGHFTASPYRHDRHDEQQRDARAVIVATRSGYAADTSSLQAKSRIWTCSRTLSCGHRAWRSATFSLECAVDELADRLGIDPIVLRLRNEPEKDPTGGEPFSDRHIVRPIGRALHALGGQKGKPGAAGERRVADRVRLRDRDLSLLPHAGGAARITVSAMPATVRSRARDWVGHSGDADDRPGRGSACRSITLVEYGDSFCRGSARGGSHQTAP